MLIKYKTASQVTLAASKLYERYPTMNLPCLGNLEKRPIAQVDAGKRNMNCLRWKNCNLTRCKKSKLSCYVDKNDLEGK